MDFGTAESGQCAGFEQRAGYVARRTSVSSAAACPHLVTDARRSRSVLVVAPERDGHAEAVMSCLSSLGSEAVLLDVGRSAAVEVHVEPGKFVRLGDGSAVGPHWTIWLRRIDYPSPPASLPAQEAALVADETLAIVLGGLLASNARWVDEPLTVARAEHTLLQLAMARRLGVRTPDSCGTSSPAKAAEFATGGPTLAKTISAGTGLAPFVDFIGPDDVELVRNGATVLQRWVPASDDLRVIVVGSTVMTWRRRRKTEDAVDWRNADPSGSGFTAVDAPFNRLLADAAVRINTALGLTVSAQDWLVPTDDGPPVFLEANPAGAWLFLKDSEELVPPVLAHHLMGADLPNAMETIS